MSPVSGTARQSAKISEDRGALGIIMCCIILAITLPLAAFAIDYGYAYEQRRELSTLADGAAMAAAREIQLRAESGESCESLRSAHEVTAIAAADSIKTATAPGGTTLTTTVTCPTGGYLLVTSVANKTTPAFFGSAFTETDGNQIQRSAKSVLAPAGQIRGIRPLAVCYDTANALIAAATGAGLGAAINMPLDRTGDTSCTDAAVASAGGGNRSRIELDPNITFAESLSTGSTSALNVTADGSLLLTSYQGEPWSNAGVTAMNSLLDTAFMMPVYSKAVKSGNNVLYQVVGFIAGRFCGWQKTPTTNASNIHKGSCYDNATPMTAGVDSIQLKYSRMVPAADLAACTSGSDTNAPCSIADAGYAPLIIKPMG